MEMEMRQEMRALVT